MDTFQIFGLSLSLEEWLKLISAVGTFVAWVRLNRLRARLEAFYTHGATHPMPNNQGVIHTHSLVVRNAGSQPATGVRISHGFVPTGTDIQIFPDRPSTVSTFGQSGSEILIDRLRPKEQITLSYLYPGPTLFHQFGTQVKFDEGFAQFFEIQHVRIFSAYVRAIVTYLMIAGFGLTLYATLKTALYLYNLS
jgi:hypothetical protein